ncbi:hypothetical protein [Paracoccus beibuensis]|uniref:hypothetical protein n=1 Tax=Paracoccus beibuensis TaxID=547602 RepID=UPI00223F9DB6|nr:hypothetical protein [Paracoccus beibuensis]
MTSDSNNDTALPELDRLVSQLRAQYQTRPIPPRLQELAKELQLALSAQKNDEQRHSKGQ